jgi:hypothetical protein
MRLSRVCHAVRSSAVIADVREVTAASHAFIWHQVYQDVPLSCDRCVDRGPQPVGSSGSQRAEEKLA